MDKGHFGDGEYEFSRWETPFENDETLDLLEVAYGLGWAFWTDTAERARWLDRSILKEPFAAELVILVKAGNAAVYRVSADRVGAFRVLDEGGLGDFWGATQQLGGRPGRSTFRIRNHAWSREGLLPWMTHSDDGWSYVIATWGDCIEIVAPSPPEITRES